jgi:hypothetical protein
MFSPSGMMPTPPAGLRRDSSVHACQRGELSVRGLARTRLKRIGIRANVNGGLKASPCIRCKMYGIGLLKPDSREVSRDLIEEKTRLRLGHAALL